MASIPLLLLPGTLCTAAVFKRQLEALQPFADRVEVVPFREECSIDEMAETVAKRVPCGSRAAIAGFSMGGMVAMALARKHPGLVAKLALLNTNSHAELPGRHQARVAHVAQARQSGIETVIAEQYLPRYLYRQENSHRKLIAKMAAELGVDCFEAQTRALANRCDSASTLEAIDCPTLILGSSDDVLCPPQEHIDMHRMVPHSDLVLLGACGHFSMLERPQAVNSCLISWYLSGDQSR